MITFISINGQNNVLRKTAPVAYSHEIVLSKKYNGRLTADLERTLEVATIFIYT